MCQHAGDVPAVLAEPEAAGSVPAEVGSLYDCLNRMLRVSQSCWDAVVTVRVSMCKFFL